ncbi:MAG: Coenzyme F420 hydrogenase/dehydrogenase, beta subunit C-terminal domain [Candidatus Freyarchaeota archaeon]
MKVGDFIIATAKDGKLSRSYSGGAIQILLKSALENKYVDKVLYFQEKKDRYNLVPVTIEQPDEIDALPLSQFSAYHVSGANNIPKFLAQSQKGTGKIALVAKPCDIRAIVELVKRKQISRDNLLILGEECYGKISPKKVKKTLEEEQVDASKVSEEKIEVKKFNISIGGKQRSYNLGEKLVLEESCKRCTEREPTLSDISFQVIEKNGGKATLLHINSQKGLKLLESASAKLNLEVADSETLNRRTRDIDLLSSEAAEYKSRQFEKFGENSEKEGYSYFKKLVENCKKCGLCIRACPLCLCVDCSVIKVRKEIDPIFYTLLRMGHMADSCVNCGNCDAVCNSLDPGPSLIFHRVSELSRKALNYEPGKNINELPPRIGKKPLKKS